MSTVITLAEAQKITHDLKQRLVGLILPSKLRTHVAYACYSIARENHSSILLLLNQENPSYATAFVRLRPTLEETLRGEWAAECASDTEIKNLALGEKKQLDMSSLVRALQLNSNGINIHDVLYKDLWSIVSAYTHTYEHPIQHWLAIELPIPNYTPEQIGWLLNTSTACFALCVSSAKQLVALAELKH